MNCHYCTRPMVDVVHDMRGCTPVCKGHEQWRRGQSSMPGHGEGCADKHVRVVIGGWLETDPRHEQGIAKLAVQISVQVAALCPKCRGRGCAACWWDGRVEAGKEKWALDPSLSREDFEQAKAQCLAANQRIPGSASPVLLVADKLRDRRLGR